MTRSDERSDMVERQLGRRGIEDLRILDAFRAVPREAFLAPELSEFAYTDTPLPIDAGQTIASPYALAATIEALGLAPRDRALLVGTGAGYSTAILSYLVAEVYSIERIASLSSAASARVAELGRTNVAFRVDDGRSGWPSESPFDAILVTFTCAEIPRALRDQLAPGGRLVVPVGMDDGSARLVRVVHESGSFRDEAIGETSYVPIARESPRASRKFLRLPRAMTPETALAALVREAAEPIEDLDSVRFDALLDRIGDARVVLIGEASHGTSEFYRTRARVTQALIERGGFDFVAVEGDWPDVQRIDDYVLGDHRRTDVDFAPFARFPRWMWRNEEVLEFVAWLRARNLGTRAPEERVSFHGLDLYSLFTSIAAVLAYLDSVDPDAARVARSRYGALTPWQRDPAAYGRAVLVGRYESSENAVVAMLRDLLERRLDYGLRDGDRFFDAAQNARVVANAERYYRAMYYGSARSWNLRDVHMFDTLRSLMAYYGEKSRAIVWAHNSHVGDASATEMSARGELDIGQLCRAAFGTKAYVIGFGTDHGTVAAASNWDAPVEQMRVRPSHPESYERIFHASGLSAFSLHLRHPRRLEVRDELEEPRLERAIGVIYRPDTERESHYFYASLPHQFDELVFIDETTAVTPLERGHRRGDGIPPSYPFVG